jgi:hypothetical protein
MLVDKLTSNQILLHREEEEEEEEEEDARRTGNIVNTEAKKGDRKQVRSRLERGTTISCFSSEIRRAAIAAPSA